MNFIVYILLKRLTVIVLKYLVFTINNSLNMGISRIYFVSSSNTGSYANIFITVYS